ncbi:MAG: methionyl-tRNA formyltransferase [Acidobacteriota bacterium]|nr:methionyl-tRNA formyltransferase [Acidobacteriota bacterium]MDW3228532.1 methionyl-tRNA formyltransferase [Acidobacteriota bacterium]MDY0230996.1 methionyl-tRNA formyltransferase [Candidatus Saccharicenans sp.]
MRIVFFGSPSIALPVLSNLLTAGHEIKLVVCQPDKAAGRGKKLTPPAVKTFAQDHNLPCLQPEKIRQDQQILEQIKEVKPELIVVVAYGQIIPAPIINLPLYKSLNVHFSLLPRYRGAAPVQWAILNGERFTGVTIFQLNEKMDEGPILSQEIVEILPRENAHELEIRLSHVGAKLLVKTIENLKNIEPKEQDHSRASYAPKLTKEQGQINWQEPAEIIDRKVRAFFSWPGAYTFFNGKKIEIISGLATQGIIPGASPGEIVQIDKSGLYVCCGQRSFYLIEKVKPEAKKEMSAYSFSLGAKIKLGSRMG